MKISSVDFVVSTNESISVFIFISSLDWLDNRICCSCEVDDDGLIILDEEEVFSEYGALAFFRFSFESERVLLDFMELFLGSLELFGYVKNNNYKNDNFISQKLNNSKKTTLKPLLNVT